MRLELASRPHRSGIGLTPLIDVVFILLLFFMLASHFHQWRALTVSATGQGATGAATPAVLVRVHNDGSIDLSGGPTSIGALSTKLAYNLQRNPALAVQIESDGGVPLQTLVEVFDQLHAAGISEMNLR